jgi:putative phosphoribosyl transferase
MVIETRQGAQVFEDRAEAGRILAQYLLFYRGEKAMVLALPRGGVVVAYEIARSLNAPLDVIVARKLGAPGQEELGIGAIAPGGVYILEEETLDWLGISSTQLERIIARETEEMNRRQRLYRGDRPLPDLQGRTVILVDDGLATGVTARAAILSIRQQKPGRLVVAVPVCALETAEKVRAEVDALICASIPPYFRSVGMWYRHFDQTTDQEVISLLACAAQEEERPASSDVLGEARI